MEIAGYFEKMGFVAYPLAICSILCIAVFLERLIFYIIFVFSVDKNSKLLETALNENKNQPKIIRDEIISELITKEKNTLYAGFKWFRLIGMISPMLGLLGTISGLILAFMEIASSKASVSPALIADGLWEAMLTTAFGLIIALPALIFLHIFKLIADKYIDAQLSSLNAESLRLEGAKI
jgi:biopolymer transport protein ExbB